MKTTDYGFAKISVEQKELEVHFDVWGEDFAFGSEIINTLEQLWNKNNNEPLGEPTRSRASIAFGYTPNVIAAKFVCAEDQESFTTTAEKFFEKKKNFIDVVKLKKEHEKELKKQKEVEADVEAKAQEILKNSKS